MLIEVRGEETPPPNPGQGGLVQWPHLALSSFTIIRKCFHIYPPPPPRNDSLYNQNLIIWHLHGNEWGGGNLLRGIQSCLMHPWLQCAERELPFCRLAEGKKTKLGRAALTSLDLQFVSDLCALLTEIFNLVFFRWTLKGHCRQEMNSPAAASIQRSAPAFFPLLPLREKVP